MRKYKTIGNQDDIFLPYADTFRAGRAAIVRHCVPRRPSSDLQVTAFWRVKDRLLPPERPPFAMRKTAFCKPIDSQLISTWPPNHVWTHTRRLATYGITRTKNRQRSNRIVVALPFLDDVPFAGLLRHVAMSAAKLMAHGGSSFFFSGKTTVRHNFVPYINADPICLVRRILALFLQLV